MQIEQEKQGQNADCSDKSKFFADNGVNEIRMRFRQEKVFLVTIAETHAQQTTIAKADEGLLDLVSRIHHIRGGIQESFQTFQLIRRGGNHRHRKQKEREGHRTQMDNFGPANEQQEKGNDRYGKSGTKIRLCHNKSETQRQHNDCRKQAMLEISDLFLSLTHVGSQIDDNGKFSNIGSLNTQRSHRQPPRRRCDLVGPVIPQRGNQQNNTGDINSWR